MYKMRRFLSALIVTSIIFYYPLISFASSEVSNSIIMDIKVPGLSLSCIDNKAHYIELIWTSSSINDIKVSYDIYRNNVLIESTESFHYVDTNVSPGINYSYIIKERDLDGQTLAESNLLTASAGDIQESRTGSAIKIDETEANILEGLKKELRFKVLDEDFETCRFIVKHKGEALKVAILNEKKKLKDFVEQLESSGTISDVEYVQPDYQIDLSSNDPYYSNQWGVENNLRENNEGFIDSSAIEKLPPHLRNSIEKDSIIYEYIMNTPIYQMEQKLLLRDLPENIDPYRIIEILQEPVVKKTKKSDAYGISPEHSCDANVSGAWKKSTGTGVTVAVIDTGININHEDLAGNIWRNSGEIENNGRDDDGNGKIDDIYGWNFIHDNNIVFSQQDIPDENHGTHIAGIIAAEKDNNFGIAGVSPNAGIMSLKVFKSGKAYTSDIINAINYAEDMGAQVVSCGWGSNAYNIALEETINNSGMLFVCSAGNMGVNIDNKPFYPAAFDSSNIISVASIGKYGDVSGFSNYGTGNVDVAAPGEEIISTLADGTYGAESGTSMAAAFVTGEAALVLAGNNMNPTEVKERIVQSSDSLPGLSGKIYRGAKINCQDAVYNSLDKEYGKTEIMPDLNSVDNSISAQGLSDYSLSSTSEPIVEGQFIKIAGGINHSLAIKKDGTVWAYGTNTFGQLGDGTNTDSDRPQQVPGLDDIIAVSAGSSHSLALKDDGTVWAWGNNECGQLGDGTDSSRTIPAKIPELTGIIEISAGYNHNIALAEDGAIWVWGDDTDGQLGIGTFQIQSTPIENNSISGIRAVAGGMRHSLLLKVDGTVWACGSNERYQLGDGFTEISDTFQKIDGLTKITRIAAGAEHNLALKNDGSVWAWGDNRSGQLGDGTTYERDTPVQLGLQGMTSVSCGSNYSLALKSDGTVWSWGDNDYGQLGISNKMVLYRTVPEQINGIENVKDIAAGKTISQALKYDETVWSWGSRLSGQVTGTAEEDQLQPLQIDRLNETIAVASGYFHSMALENDGTVWAWGNNERGQLGDGTFESKSSPVKVKGLSGIIAIAGGSDFSLALSDRGKVYAWGNNGLGQLGNGGTDERKSTPEEIPGLNNIIAIAAGYTHALALRSDGTVWAWGFNYSGQIGQIPGYGWFDTPQLISGLPEIKAIASGDYHCLALDYYGSVWAWGHLYAGGMGFRGGQYIPVMINDAVNVKLISGGGNFSIFSDGLIKWVFGNNSEGQLGPDGWGDYTVPAVVSSTYFIKEISCGDSHSLELDIDGLVWSRGANYFGQLGTGNIQNSDLGEQVVGLEDVRSITAGAYHNLALKNDGTVWTWGYNYYGQLGNSMEENENDGIPRYAYGTPFNCFPMTSTWSGTGYSGKNIDLVLSINNIKSFEERIFTVTYNVNEMFSVSDLCKITYKKEIVPGEIEGTGITIVQNDPGIIKFTVDKDIPGNKMWSGVVNIIQLKSAVTGQVTFMLTVE